MPGYTKMNLQQQVSDIVGQVRPLREREKKGEAGAYTSKSKQFDTSLMQVVREGLEQARLNTSMHAKDVESSRLKCKAKVDWIDTKLKQPKLDAKEYLAIRTEAQLINKLVDEMHVWRREFADAMAKGYRGTWYKLAIEGVSDKKLMQPFENTRKDMIDLDNTVSSLAMRCDEYVTRAAELVKQATQREKGGAINVEEFGDDIDKHQRTMIAHKTFITESIYALNTSLDFFAQLGKKKPKDYTEDDRKFGTSRLATIERAAKEVRGRLKTMKVEHEGLEKRAKAAGPGWKERALKAVKASDTLWSEAKDASGRLDKDEADAVKTLKKVMDQSK